MLLQHERTYAGKRAGGVYIDEGRAEFAALALADGSMTSTRRIGDTVTVEVGELAHHLVRRCCRLGRA